MIRVDTPQVTALVGRLEDVSSNFAKDIARTVADTKRRITADASRCAGAVYNIGRNAITGRWKVNDSGVFAFTLFASRKPIIGLDYGATESRGSVAVKFLRDSKRGRIPKSFFAQNPFGDKRLPWIRTGDAKRPMSKGRYKGAKTASGSPLLREPIRPVYGPSLADMLKNPKVLEPLSVLAIQRMTEQLTRRIDRITSRG